MSEAESKRAIERALRAFAAQALEAAATAVLGSLANNQGGSHSRNAKRTCGANC